MLLNHMCIHTLWTPRLAYTHPGFSPLVLPSFITLGTVLNLFCAFIYLSPLSFSAEKNNHIILTKESHQTVSKNTLGAGKDYTGIPR